MLKVPGRQVGIGVAMLLCASCVTSAAQAEDFLSALFGAFGGHRSRGAADATAVRNEGAPTQRSTPARVDLWRRPGLLRADLRRPLFPDHRHRTIRAAWQPATASARRAETRLVYGSNIDSAATETGKPYSELPNAFRYRNEIVAGCTCNGKDQFGLAPIKIDNDPDLAQGRHRRDRPTG